MASCYTSELDEPTRKVIRFTTRLTLEEANSHQVTTHVAHGYCTFEAQICEGGTLANKWVVSSKAFQPISSATDHRRWNVSLENGWVLNVDFPGCAQIAHSPLSALNYRLWLDKTPDLLPHQKTVLTMHELIQADAVEKHGVRVINLFFEGH